MTGSLAARQSAAPFVIDEVINPMRSRRSTSQALTEQVLKGFRMLIFSTFVFIMIFMLYRCKRINRINFKRAARLWAALSL